MITVSCLLLGYPIAFLLAHPAAALIEHADDPRAAALLDLAAGANLRLEGVACSSRASSTTSSCSRAIVSDDGRLVMINNQTGTIIAMTHILLPFMILPLYSVMKTISPTYVRAAKSLGATDWTAFWRVYFPQSCRASGRARSSSSSWRSATTSRRNWSAARGHLHLEPDRLSHLQLAQLGTCRCAGVMLLAAVLILYLSTTRSSASIT
jgi:hypothetical protein